VPRDALAHDFDVSTFREEVAKAITPLAFEQVPLNPDIAQICAQCDWYYTGGVSQKGWFGSFAAERVDLIVRWADMPPAVILYDYRQKGHDDSGFDTSVISAINARMQARFGISLEHEDITRFEPFPP
jgi:hypothetical protein